VGSHVWVHISGPENARCLKALKNWGVRDVEGEGQDEDLKGEHPYS